MTSLTANGLTVIRNSVLGAAGLVCASYSILAFVQNTPQPFSSWLPGVAGVCAAIVIWVSASLAGRRNTGIAMDELYRAEWRRAVRFGYWFGLVLYVVFGVALAWGWIGYPAAFASMGTAFGAGPLIAFCVITIRG